MDTRALFEWLRSLLADIAVITPSHPEPPFYPEILAGSEHDLRPVMVAIAQSEHDSLAPVIEGIKAWIAAHREHVRTGHDLCHGLGLAIGECEPADDGDDRLTDPIGEVVFRANWEPDHEADRRAQLAELTETLAELQAAIGPVAFAAALAHGGQTFEASPPPLTLELEPLLLSPPPAATDGRVLPLAAPPDSGGITSPGIPTALSRLAREAEPAEPTMSGLRTQWIAAVGGAVALAAVVTVALLPDTAEPRPLPVSAVDYPTCPVSVSSAPVEHPATREPARELAPPAPLPAAAPPPAPPPRRKVSTVKLTEIDGVRVRRRGRPDVVISAHEAAPDEQAEYVINADEHAGSGIAFPGETDWALVVEMVAEQ